MNLVKVKEISRVVKRVRMKVVKDRQKVSKVLLKGLDVDRTKEMI